MLGLGLEFEFRDSVRVGLEFKDSARVRDRVMIKGLC